MFLKDGEDILMKMGTFRRNKKELESYVTKVMFEDLEMIKYLS